MTPNPLQMVSGQYTGQHAFSVGPRQDFDLGDVMVPDDNLIVLDFLLDVQHELKVDVPPGGDKIRLVPSGGWQNWLQAGRRPERLFRDQLFHISASSRFKMLLDCRIADFDCVIEDLVSKRIVKLKISVSMPDGVTDYSGHPVKNLLLRAGPSYGRIMQPGRYIDREPGVLHFEIARHEMSQMLLPGVAARYSGHVTVIWDSEA